MVQKRWPFEERDYEVLVDDVLVGQPNECDPIQDGDPDAIPAAGTDKRGINIRDLAPKSHRLGERHIEIHRKCRYLVPNWLAP